jgi:UDP-N-acetylmuramyl pentapeptide phosphotransferase/UDP-N-acetylglucosamine-1-phosphate transferase
MTNGGESRHNWRAAIVLGIALVMVLLGLTLLSSFLFGLIYIFYWLVCIVFTLLALIFAYADLQRLRQRSREEQRELIERALDSLPEAAKEKRRRSEDQV